MEDAIALAGPPRTPVRTSTRGAAAVASAVVTPSSAAAGPSSVPLESLEAPDPLPAPPGTGPAGTSTAAASKRAMSEVPAAQGVGRAKRTRPNVKYSPAKTGKVARGRLATSGSVPPTRLAASQPEPVHVGESCEVCGTAGLYVCCDGCPRVFHPLCVDPPLMGVEDAGDHWFCRECTVSKVPPIPPPKSLFSKLILKAELENPKVFKLPRSLRVAFEHVGTNPHTGDYVDEAKLKGKPKLDAKGYAEEPDPYRTKTKDGRSILCFMCGQAASLAKKKRIISCDSCEQHFHLDCLDPPLAAPPPSVWKWTCPLHADKAAPKKRVSKHSAVAKITGPNKANNGDIEVISRPENRRGPRAVEEIVHNRLRFQVPEDVIVLDFWAKVKGEHKRGDEAALGGAASEISSLSGDDSPLTPLSELEGSMHERLWARDLLSTSAASSSRLSSVVSDSSPRHNQPLLPGLIGTSAGTFSRLSSHISSDAPAPENQPPVAGPSFSRQISRDSPALSLPPVNGRRGRSSNRYPSRSSVHAQGTNDATPAPEAPLDFSKLDQLARIALEMESAPKAAPASGSKTPKRIRIKGTKYLNASNASIDIGNGDIPSRAGSMPPALEPSPPSQTNGTLAKDVKGKAPAVNGTSHLSEASDGSGPMLGYHTLDRREHPSFAMSNLSPSPAPSVQERSSDSNDFALSVTNPDDLQALMHVRRLLSSDYASQKGGLLKFVAGSDSAVPQLAWVEAKAAITPVDSKPDVGAMVVDTAPTRAIAERRRPTRRRRDAGEPMQVDG